MPPGEVFAGGIWWGTEIVKRSSGQESQLLLGLEVGVEALDVLQGVGSVLENIHGAWIYLAFKAGVFGIGGHDLAVPTGEVGGFDAGAVERTGGVGCGLEFADDGGVEVGGDFIFESECPEGGVDEKAAGVFIEDVFGGSEGSVDDAGLFFGAGGCDIGVAGPSGVDERFVLIDVLAGSEGVEDLNFEERSGVGGRL